MEAPGIWIASFAVLVSIAALVMTVYVAKRGTSLPIELALLSEFRAPESREARRVVIRLAFSPHHIAGGFDAQEPLVRDALRSVAHFYDHVGLLIANGFVRKRPFVEFMGLSAHQCWYSARKIVESERTNRGTDEFLKYFQQFGEKELRKEVQDAFDRWKFEVDQVPPAQPGAARAIA